MHRLAHDVYAAVKQTLMDRMGLFSHLIQNGAPILDVLLLVRKDIARASGHPGEKEDQVLAETPLLLQVQINCLYVYIS